VDAETGGSGIGLAVRRARHSRGMTLEQLAGRVGKSKAWLSMIENGRRQLDKRSDIAALAEALEVSADALIGQPAPEIQAGKRSWNLRPLRTVLLDASPGDPPDIPARPVPELRALNTEVDGALRRADYEAMHRQLPDLLGELLVHSAISDSAERKEALQLFILAAASASIMLRHLGRTDLGWIAADRGRQAAILIDDPVWSAASAFQMAHSLSSVNKSRALLATPKVADELESRVGDSQFAREVYGMLRLSAALACAVRGDHAGAAGHGEEAARIAEPMGDRPDAWELFGPANVGVWRTSLAVEAGNAEDALRYAAGVEPRVLASGNRRAALRIEKARAFAMLGGHDGEAIAELRRAEKLSPQQVHNYPLVRELVTGMLERARRNAGGRDLRGLAWRMGVI
jgi:transcriptional regulator with XRE-family HTH domain